MQWKEVLSVMRKGLLSCSKAVENKQHISWMSSVLQHQLSQLGEEEMEKESEAMLVFFVTTLLELLQDHLM